MCYGASVLEHHPAAFRMMERSWDRRHAEDLVWNAKIFSARKPAIREAWLVSSKHVWKRGETLSILFISVWTSRCVTRLDVLPFTRWLLGVGGLSSRPRALAELTSGAKRFGLSINLNRSLPERTFPSSFCHLGSSEDCRWGFRTRQRFLPGLAGYHQGFLKRDECHNLIFPWIVTSNQGIINRSRRASDIQ